MVCFYPNETEDDLYFPTPQGLNVNIPEIVSKDVFSIEIE